jgi:Fe-S-cluster-containing dehydrogenase component/DMSO reductase anchor subunit
MTSSLATPSARLVLAEVPQERRRLPLVEQFLREQQELTAVQRFAQRHADAQHPARERYYKDLLPASAPSAHEQYAFEVDLDACSGCKACVTACHNLNGLDDGETWRSVGLLHGGSAAAPVQQAITTACHHCLDPACLNGCPVLAYEKDPVTGIVKHLDDQCIGCQYCTFTCPYDVPQYSAARGIVRKCDMCHDRLAVGEAPACVQACPNEAISITLVDRRQALQDAQGGAFLPGAPPPGITIPATVYKTTRVLPRNLLPANFYAVKPSHHHTPLVVMLVLTQLSAGAFFIDAAGARLVPAEVESTLGPVHSLVAVALGLAALAASLLHLGRPLYAFRALLGLRTSWMSREILAFGLFAPLAILYATSFWFAPLAQLQNVLRVAVAATGIAGVLCSVLIYHVTRRAWWGAPATGCKFFLTAAILGLATTGLTLSVGAGSLGSPILAAPFIALKAPLVRLLIAACLIKATAELLALRHANTKHYTELKRSAVLLMGDLRNFMIARFALLAAGIAAALWEAQYPLSIPAASTAWTLLLVGELLERTLFFAALSSPALT